MGFIHPEKKEEEKKEIIKGAGGGGIQTNIYILCVSLDSPSFVMRPEIKK